MRLFICKYVLLIMLICWASSAICQRYSYIYIIEMGDCIDSNALYKSVKDRRLFLKNIDEQLYEIHFLLGLMYTDEREAILIRMKSKLDSIAPEVRHFESYMCNLPYRDFMDQYYGFLGIITPVYGDLNIMMNESERRLYRRFLQGTSKVRHPPCIFPEFPEYTPLMIGDSIPRAEPVRNLPFKRIEDHLRKGDH
jgi:hypothetical protein